MKALPVYYASELLSTQEQKTAANRLLGLLLLREQLKGRNVSYFAIRWGKKPNALLLETGRTRIQVFCHPSISTWKPEDCGPSMIPLATIRENLAKYASALDDLEADYVMTLDDERTETLIRQMFDDKPTAVFAAQRPSRTTGRAAAKRRPPGRPPGSKNKPKEDAQRTEEGWPMPDGFVMPSMTKGSVK